MKEVKTKGIEGEVDSWRRKVEELEALRQRESQNMQHEYEKIKEDYSFRMK